MIGPGIPNPLMFSGGDPLDEYFKVERSVRFNAADAPSLTRTPGVAGNSKTFTINFSVKRSTLDTNQVLFHANASTSAFKIYFNGADNQLWVDANNGTLTFAAHTARLFRDLASHADVTVAIDTTQATKEAGVRIEVDGVVDTVFSSANWTQNADTWWNRSGVVHSIGCGIYTSGTSYSADAYLSNIRIVDGQFLSAASFSRTHPRTGQRRPIRYSGTYGTLGSNPDFSDGSAATSGALGKDRSGNNNDWTPANISVAAGVGCDWLLDTPTNNFCTLNSTDNVNSSNTISDGGLRVTTPVGANYRPAKGTISVNSGAFYWEVHDSGGSPSSMRHGVVADSVVNDYIGNLAGEYAYMGSTGQKWTNGAGSAYGATFATGDIIGVKLDMDAGTLEFFKNGVSQGVAYSGLSGYFRPASGDATNIGGGYTTDFNFGQRAFAYPANQGTAKTLCTKNLPIKPKGPMKPSSAFVAVTDTGANIQATLAAARPGWTNYIEIFKSLGAEGWRWRFSDDIGNYLDSSSTAAKAAFPALAGASYVGYGLKVSAANGIATGRLTHVNGVADVVSDGLSNTRKAVILKNEATGAWFVYHPDLTAGKLLYMNTAAETVDATISAVTASGFTVASSIASGTYRWISLAETDGFLKLNKRTGNVSADGPFSNDGFSPAFSMSKLAIGAATGYWEVIDAARSPSNLGDAHLYMDKPDGSSTQIHYAIDRVSNGVKVRTADAQSNASGYTYVSIDVAEFPFRYANAK